jgi:hypothetical protein
MGLFQLPLTGMPRTFQSWVPQFLSDLMYPLKIFSLGFAIGGIALLIISFVYPKGEGESD